MIFFTIMIKASFKVLSCCSSTNIFYHQDCNIVRHFHKMYTYFSIILYLKKKKKHLFMTKSLENDENYNKTFPLFFRNISMDDSAYNANRKSTIL